MIDLGKKYQVFISSTYEDLREERSIASNTLLKLDCIPVGMEQFPASNMSQIEYIEIMLDSCDYYVLISAGRYGSLDSMDGIGYTEKEYDLAISKGIPIMTFILRDIDSLPAEKKETKDELRQKLYAFRTKLKNNKMVSFYSSKEELQGQIAISLYNCIKDYPAVGWIRAEGKDIDTALEKKMDEYISEHKWQGTYYQEEDNDAGGKTVTIGKLEKRINMVEEMIPQFRLEGENLKIEYPKQRNNNI